MKRRYNERELYHYGIKGQRWYVRRFEDKNGRLTREGKERYYPKGLQSKTNSKDKLRNKAITAAVMVVAGSLVAYGGYKLYSSHNDSDSNSAVDAVLSDFGSKPLSEITFGENKKALNLGRSPSDVDVDFIRSINGEGRVNPYRRQNCEQCSVAYILGSVFGIKCEAKEFNGVDEKSGIVRTGREWDVLNVIFGNVKNEIHRGEPFESVLSKIPNNTTGILGLLNKDRTGHAINFEKGPNGEFSYIDCQSGEAYIVNDFSYLNKIYDNRFISVCEFGPDSYVNDDAKSVIDAFVTIK